MSSNRAPRLPVVRAAYFSIAHAPHLVLSGSKPRRELAREGDALRARLLAHLRGFADAVAYPPHQVMIGNLAPEALRDLPRPWHRHPVAGAAARGRGGRILDERTLYAGLARGDANNLVAVDPAFAAEHGLPAKKTLDRERLLAEVSRGAEPLHLRGEGGELFLAGIVRAAHEEDESLSAPVLLENLAARVTGAFALAQLLEETPTAEPIDFLLGCGEEAIGDRYQRGGGNLAKAIGELAGQWVLSRQDLPARERESLASSVRAAGGADVKSFCASPVHAMIIGAALISSGLYRRVVVTGGGSLPKLGMKVRGHLEADYPVLEDVITGVAIDLAADDGASPVLPLDGTAVHRVADGSAPHQLAARLTVEPLAARGLRLSSVDRFAVELHNPDITEPAGSGDVPANNYRIISALAAKAGEITREGMDTFSRAHGLPGFSPTQGHIASAVPYLPHAIHGLTEGPLDRVQFIAKGSLFLGRMTEIGDGASFLLERNPARARRGAEAPARIAERSG